MEKDRVQINVHMDPLERKTLDRLAAQDMRSLSETVRTLIREEARDRGLWPPAELKESQIQKANGG